MSFPPVGRENPKFETEAATNTLGQGGFDGGTLIASVKSLNVR